jgi:oxygen-independent coproporphyrinogen-3 oxidase
LHRNFQGYCSRRTTGQVYAFGASAISQMENGYSQNTKEVSSYIRMIKEGKPAVEKGYILSRNQIIIRDLITILMCNNHINLNDFADQHSISPDDLKEISGYSESKLSGFISDGMVTLNSGNLMVTELGSLFIRNIAACFDPEYRPQINQYSQPV